MITELPKEVLAKIDWNALDKVRHKAEAAVKDDTMDKARWQELFKEALVATGGHKGKRSTCSRSTGCRRGSRRLPQGERRCVGRRVRRRRRGCSAS